jgi:hypothetical protein
MSAHQVKFGALLEPSADRPQDVVGWSTSATTSSRCPTTRTGPSGWTRSRCCQLVANIS